MHPLTRCDFSSLVFFLKAHNPSLIRKKIIKKTRLRGILQKTYTVFLKIIKTTQKRALSNKLAQTRGDWGDVTLKCNVERWTGSWKINKLFLDTLVKPT